MNTIMTLIESVGSAIGLAGLVYFAYRAEFGKQAIGEKDSPGILQRLMEGLFVLFILFLLINAGARALLGQSVLSLIVNIFANPGL